MGDVGKGVAVVLLARVLTDNASIHAAAAGVVVAGHIWPVFAGFRGGRGVATGFGVSLVLEPWVGLLALAVFVLVVLVTRYVSLGSICSALAIAFTFAATALIDMHPMPYLGFAVATGSLVIFMHRDNVRRLLSGTERRLGERDT